jgi:hypothetical protein
MQSDASPYNEEVVRKLIWSLTVLGTVKQNDKVWSTGGVLQVDPPTAQRSLVRRWYGECRADNVVHIEDLAHRSMNVVNSGRSVLALSTHHVMQYSRLLGALRDCRLGLANMCYTYADDRTHVARINMLVHEISDFLVATSEWSAAAASGDSHHRAVQLQDSPI